MLPRVAAVIPAAGAGTRLRAGQPEPKALRRLAGRSLLEWSLSSLAPSVGSVVVAAPPHLVRRVEAAVERIAVEITVVAGGATRQQSVSRALEALPPQTDLVLVHDAARPLVPEAVVARVLDALRGGARAVVPAVPVTDALRQIADSASSAATATSVDSTSLDRSRVRAVQTPQGFQLDVLLDAHRAAPDLQAADDAVLVERRGVSVTLVHGSELSFKVTHPLDLMLAEAAVAAMNPAAQQ